jgi:hypothetical protein
MSVESLDDQLAIAVFWVRVLLKADFETLSAPQRTQFAFKSTWSEATANVEKATGAPIASRVKKRESTVPREVGD